MDIREQANLLDLTHDAIFVRDMDATITHWNRAAEELYGWTAAQAVGRRSHDLLKTVFPIPLQHIREILMRDGRWEGELVHTTKAGTPVIVESRWSLQSDEKGTPLAILESNYDIAEQKQAKEALRIQAERLQSLYSANLALSQTLDLEALLEQLLEVTGQVIPHDGISIMLLEEGGSLRVRAQRGFRSDAVPKLATGVSFPAESLPLIARVLQRKVSLEVPDTHQEPEWVWLRGAEHARSWLGVPLVAGGDLIGLLSLDKAEPGFFSADYQELAETFAATVAIAIQNARLYQQTRTSEAAARRSEKELRDVIETIPGMVWSAAADGSVDFLNRYWRDFTGLSMEESLGWDWQPAIHPDEVEQYVEKWSESIATGQPFESEVRFRRAADGQYRWFWEKAVPLKDEQGNVLKWYGFITDIEDRKRAEEGRERLRELEADLLRINRVSMMGELAASLGHEMKQPIAAAITSANACLRWMNRDQPDLEEARAAASTMVKDALRAAEIINRTSSLYQKGPSQRERVSINDLIDEIVALLCNEAARSDVFISSDLAPDLPDVMGDRIQLQQVLMNLMINGIDAMQGIEGVRELALTSRLEGSDQVLVTVSDTGTGLPPEKEQIFEAFFSTKPQGTGMGLAISWNIIESHAGRLSGNSNPDRGATFWFTLPTGPSGRP